MTTSDCITIEGVEYSLKRNNRAKLSVEMWTLLRDGKPFATVAERNGSWDGTFQTKGLRSALWNSSPNVTLEERIRKYHEADKGFRQRLVVI